MRKLVLITESAIDNVVFESRKLGRNELLRIECDGEFGKDVLDAFRERLGKEYYVSHECPNTLVKHYASRGIKLLREIYGIANLRIFRD